MVANGEKIDGLAFGKLKNDPVTIINGKRPIVFELTFQLMRPERRMAWIFPKKNDSPLRFQFHIQRKFAVLSFEA
jgi:hypothetical protein